MPINDSAGVGVYLIDKSQRASVAIGFRSAGAIEADRGLCNTPTLISSEADYVKIFGSPSMERHGLAAMEAYMLAQRKVPQVLTRAKNPMLTPNDNVFGMVKFFIEDGKLKIDTTSPATAIVAPVEENESLLFFKGEGTYPKKQPDESELVPRNSSNIVLRFSEPITQSAYATSGRTLRVQVYDFDGANHIDKDTHAELAFNPDVSSLIDADGKFKLDGYKVGPEDVSGSGLDTLPVKITAFVNGRSYQKIFDYNSIDANGIYEWIKTVVCQVEDSSNNPIIKEDWMQYVPNDSSANDGLGEGGYYLLDSREEDKGYAQQLNCFGLSVTITIEAILPISEEDEPGHRKLSAGFYGYPCGSVNVTKQNNQGSITYSAKFNISTNLYLKNRTDYMYMGPQNSYWASYYQTYCKDDAVVSFSYDDYDANYITMQADAVLNGSNYVVPKSSETFGDYRIDYTTDEITTKLHYFEGEIEENTIAIAQKSHAYSIVLQNLLADNLVRWRCLATPNLGDVMIQADFIEAITKAEESTLGISNIGRAASTNVFGTGNMGGRHGNRFIADYAQYAYRTLAGKRTAVTMASLVTDLLNTHYNEGIEARPPFGYNYGQITCLSLSQQYSGAERNILARQYKINPVIEDGGFFIWEERTSQITDTSLSDIHSIISFIWMKFAIYDAMKAFVAEYNDEETVNRGLAVLNQLNQTFITRKYIEEGIVSADKNVIGDEVLRFDYAVRFKGVARFVDVYITAYSQTQTLAVSLAEEA